MTKKAKSCGGACCRRFIIQSSPEELKKEYEAWLRNPGPGHFQFETMEGRTAEKYVHAEIYLIYPMLIYLGRCEANAYAPNKKTPGQFSHHYTCKHHDAKTGLCTIYEYRPFMCRHYPNGRPCPYPNCKLPGNEKKKREEARMLKRMNRPAKKLRLGPPEEVSLCEST